VVGFTTGSRGKAPGNTFYKIIMIIIIIIIMRLRDGVDRRIILKWILWKKDWKV
jgi:hypothetical protein